MAALGSRSVRDLRSRRRRRSRHRHQRLQLRAAGLRQRPRPEERDPLAEASRLVGSDLQPRRARRHRPRPRRREACYTKWNDGKVRVPLAERPAALLRPGRRLFGRGVSRWTGPPAANRSSAPVSRLTERCASSNLRSRRICLSRNICVRAMRAAAIHDARPLYVWVAAAALITLIVAFQQRSRAGVSVQFNDFDRWMI